jgi:di/tricarboxylate transporter
MKPEFIVLALILLGALYLFWTQRLRTDITALLVMLSLAFPWPRPDGKWSAILSPQEAFSGFGSVAVIMVTAMFVFSAAMVRTGAAEMIGGRLFRACAHNELLLQIAVLFVAAAFSMFINETTIVLVFMPVVLGVCKERNLSPSRYLLCAAYGAALGGQWTLIGTRSNIIVSDLLRQRTGQGINFFDFHADCRHRFRWLCDLFFSGRAEVSAESRGAIVGAGTRQGVFDRGDGYAAISHRRTDPRPTRLG